MSVRIALVGDENPTFPSHRELNAVRGQLGEDIVTHWVPTGSPHARDLSAFDGIWLTPGSPYADDAAAYDAVTFARENDVPFLGTCGGLQYAVVEFCRNVLNVEKASHAEVDGEGVGNVVTALACSLQGQEREVRPVPGTRFDELVGGRSFPGMHYCRYAPDPDQLDQLTAAGMLVEATADDAGAEVLEVPALRFFLLSLFQPQVGASRGMPLHPLLAEFVTCARAHAIARTRIR